MKFTLGEIYGLTKSLQKLTDKELPLKISFRLLKFLRDCSEEMEILEKARIKLVEKYSEEKKEGSNDIKVSEENKDKFQEEFSILLNEQIEINYDPISVDDLGDIKISTNDLIPMQKIFKELQVEEK